MKKLSLLLLVCSLLWLTPTSTQAYNENDLAAVRNGRGCPAADLSHAD